MLSIIIPPEVRGVTAEGALASPWMETLADVWWPFPLVDEESGLPETFADMAARRAAAQDFMDELVIELAEEPSDLEGAA